ncbi:hypothetical protein [Actinomadura sp. WMMA1423]|uniref:hypothetical protein n=1 Tax=Actinomadura sp. WMMA1423 TaxID=2591108 RepID=UPI0011464514|nr:hypothetical protein [Actinomadura sp. WMMA1423]
MTVIGRLAASRIAWLGVAGVALALTGCSNDNDAVALPSSSHTTPSLPSPSSDEEAVKETYTSFISTLDRADSLPDESRRQQLSALMVDPQLSRVLQRVEELRSKNLTSYGKVIVHITSVDVAGNDATLHDCQDSSRAGIMNRTTRKKIKRGVEKGRTKAYLIKGADEKWRISKYVVLGEGC